MHPPRRSRGQKGDSEMRLSYYEFPEGTPESVLLENECAVVLKDGSTVYVDSIPEDKRPMVDYIERTVSCSVSYAKKMMKQYGGCGWTQHIDRDGGCFEVSEIKLSGNNSHFKYNHHL